MECDYSTPCEKSIFAPQIRQLLGEKKEKSVVDSYTVTWAVLFKKGSSSHFETLAVPGVPGGRMLLVKAREGSRS
jgi:hypothetical protein